MKRILALILCAALLINSFPLVSFATSDVTSNEEALFPSETPIVPSSEDDTIEESTDEDSTSEESSTDAPITEPAAAEEGDNESIDPPSDEDDPSVPEEPEQSRTEAEMLIEAIMSESGRLDDVIQFFDIQELDSSVIPEYFYDKAASIIGTALAGIPEAAVRWWNNPTAENTAFFADFPLTKLKSIWERQDFPDNSLTSVFTSMENIVNEVRSHQDIPSLSIKEYLMYTAQRESYTAFRSELLSLLKVQIGEDVQLKLITDDYSYQFGYAELTSLWKIQSQREGYPLYLAPHAGNPNDWEEVSVHLTSDEDGFRLSGADGRFLDYSQASGFFTDLDGGAVLLPLISSGEDDPLPGYSVQKNAELLKRNSFLICFQSSKIIDTDGRRYAVPVLYLLCPDLNTPIIQLKEGDPVEIPDVLSEVTIEIPTAVEGTLPNNIGGEKNIQLYPESTETRTLVNAFVSQEMIPAAGESTPPQPESTPSKEDTSRTTFTITANDVSIAEAALEVPKITAWDHSAVALSSCAFQLIPANSPDEGEKKYYVYSNGIFLSLGGTDSTTYTNVMTTEHSLASAVTVTFENGFARFTDENNRGLYYMPGQGTLSNEAGKTAHAYEYAFLNDFVLFRKAGNVYYRASSIEDNGLYLIVADMSYDGAECVIMTPSAQGGTSTLVGSDINLIGHSTDILFTGLTLPDAVESNAAFLDSYYSVTVTTPGSAADLLSTLVPLDPLPPDKDVVHLGITINIQTDGTTSATPVYILNTQNDYRGKEFSLAPESNGPIKKEDIEVISLGQNETFAGIGNGGSYNQASIPLSDCLYRFIPVGDEKYTIKAVKDDSLGYLNASSHALTDEGETAFSVENLPNGLFQLKQVSNNALIHFWRWKLFISTASPYYANDKLGTDQLLLFTRAENGKGHSMLPGYDLATSVTANGEYLIGAVYEQQLYFIHPTLSNGNNDHTAVRTKEWSPGSCEIKIQPTATTGTSVLVFEDENRNTTYYLNFQEVPASAEEKYFIAGTGAGKGGPLKKLIISSGLQFQLLVDDAIYEENGLEWFTSDPTYGRIDHNGLLTLMNPQNLKSQQQKEFSVYVKAGGSYYRLPVTLTKNDYTSTRLFDQYIGALENTTVYMSYPRAGVNTYSDSYTAAEYNFIPMDEFQATYLLRDVSQNWGAHYFAKPDDGYALAYMSASGSAGQYYKLDDANAENTEYYSNGPCYTQRILYDDAHTDIIKNMLQYAIDKGCVGAMGFTGQSGSTGTQSSVLAFRSEKLPTVEKSVAYVFDAQHRNELNDFLSDVRGSETLSPVNSDYSSFAYREGSEVGVGSTVIFKITVLKPENPSAVSDGGTQAGSQRRITYRAVTLTESMVDPKLNGIRLENPTFIVPAVIQTRYQLPNGASSLNLLNLVNSTEAEATYTFYVQYTIPRITVSDKEYSIGKDIELTNNVNLTTTFRTFYQSVSNLTLYSSARAALTLAISNCLEYVNLSLDEGISANVFLNLDSFNSWYDNDHFIVFEINRKVVDSAKKRIKQHGLESHFTPLGETADKTFYRFSLPVSPFDLFSPIDVYIVDSKGARVSDKFQFTVNAYINKILSSEDLITQWQYEGVGYSFGEAVDVKEKLNTLLKALRSYANYAIAWKDNSPLPPGTDAIDPRAVFESMGAAAPFTTNCQGNGITFTGLSQYKPEDRAAVSLTVHFTSERRIDTQTAECVVQDIVDDIAYSYYYPIKECTASACQESNPDAYCYEITIHNIGGKLLGSTIQVEIWWNKSERSKADSIILTPKTYAYLLKKQHSGDTYSHLEYMECALYQYITAADAFFDFQHRYVPSS